MRIAVAGISHETNTFSTLRTTLTDFGTRRGEECIAGSSWEALKEAATLLPCLTAGATPNGLVAKDAYLALKDELVNRLEATLPIDGLFLPLHGAMHVDGIGDGETDLLRDIRKLVGEDLPIAASLDLHGNLSPEFVRSVDILSALRTAPHIDGQETRERTFRHLVRAINTGKKPSTAMFKLPLLLPGEYAVTAVEPSRSLYAYINELELLPGIWDASLMISCAWTDSPFTSVSTLVVGEEANEANRLATEFADRVWEHRAEFGPEVETISAEEAIQKALNYQEGPIFISESGDNVTAGGAGDVTTFLEQVIHSGLQDVLYAGIADSEAVRKCVQAGVGRNVELDIGGRLDAVNGEPLHLEAKVIRLEPKTATVQIGEIAIVITEGRSSFHTLAAFERSGIDPLAKKVVIVKQGYLAPDLREKCSTTFMALTPGFTDLRIKDLAYREVLRPIYPLDPM